MLFSSCAFRRVNRTKNIPYQSAEERFGEQSLNVFAPKKLKETLPVLVFIHGGGWNSGKKEMYSFFGARWARRDVISVVIDYPKSAEVKFYDMAQACAKALAWTENNIKSFGGDTSRIFLAGHSAGGHLAGLIALDSSYFNGINEANPIKGMIMLDAAGFDMHAYLQKEQFPANHTYLSTFTEDPDVWKKGSLNYHINKDIPPMLLYCGSKSFPDLIVGTEMFVEKAKPYNLDVKYTLLKGKSHIEMITQFFWGWSKRYDEIKTFIDAH